MIYTVLATMDGQPLLLAQPDVDTKEEVPPEDLNGDNDDSTGGLFDSPMVMIILIGMMVLWIFLLGSGSRKQKKKQAEMLAGMSKGSKIVTIGGIKGSIVELRDDEVVVKVDENNNTRMRFSRDAIRTVVDESAGKDEPVKETKDVKKD